MLAKRLLNHKSFSLDSEKLAVTGLKQTCGPQFTYRIEGMLNDLHLAQDFEKVSVSCPGTHTSKSRLLWVCRLGCSISLVCCWVTLCLG
jgi:hypothetical protein